MAAADGADPFGLSGGKGYHHYDDVPTLETDSSASDPRGFTATIASLERQHQLELQMEQDTYKRLLREMAEKYERRIAELEGALQTARVEASQRAVSDRLQAVLDQQEQEIDELLSRLQESEQEVGMLCEKVRLLQQPSHFPGDGLQGRPPVNFTPHGTAVFGEQATAPKAAVDGALCQRCSQTSTDNLAAVHADRSENTALAQRILQRDLGIAGPVPGSLSHLLPLISERCADVMATLTALRDFTTSLGEMVWNYDDGAVSDSSPADGVPVLAVELHNLQQRLRAILSGKQSAPVQPHRRLTPSGGAVPLVPRCASLPRRKPSEGVAMEKQQEMLQSAGLRPKPRPKPQGWDNSLFKPKDPFRN